VQQYLQSNKDKSQIENRNSKLLFFNHPRKFPPYIERLFLAQQYLRRQVPRQGPGNSTKYTLFEKTNPILKMQNEHNTLHIKHLKNKLAKSSPKTNPTKPISKNRELRNDRRVEKLVAEP
jgi:hypothetical protein